MYKFKKTILINSKLIDLLYFVTKYQVIFMLITHDSLFGKQQTEVLHNMGKCDVDIVMYK